MGQGRVPGGESGGLCPESGGWVRERADASHLHLFPRRGQWRGMKLTALILSSLLMVVFSGCGPATFGTTGGGRLTEEQEARRVDAWLRLQESLTRVGTSVLTAAEAAAVAKINKELKVEASGK